jgi:hypothetical protein
MLPPKARSPMRGKSERAPAKVGFGKRDKLPDSKRSTLRQQRALALWRGSKPVAGTPADGYLTAKKPTVGGDAPAIRQRDSEPTQEPTAAVTSAATVTSPNHPLIDEMRCGLPPTDNFNPSASGLSGPYRGVCNFRRT